MKYKFALIGIIMIIVLLLLIPDNFVMHLGFTLDAFIGLGIVFLFGSFLLVGDLLHKLD
jgi:hypothetical protein